MVLRVSILGAPHSRSAACKAAKEASFREATPKGSSAKEVYTYPKLAIQIPLTGLRVWGFGVKGSGFGFWVLVFGLRDFGFRGFGFRGFGFWP